MNRTLAAMPTPVSDSKPLQVLLPTLGSAGDVHPFIALGLALRARGHRATILTNPYFQPLIERLGLHFLPVGTLADVDAAIGDPNLWHARKGFGVVAQRVMVPAIEEIYRLIEAHAGADTVVAASGISLGARIAQEKLKIPTATVHLQPAIVRSLVDQGMVGNMRISASQPMWFKRAFFRLVDWAAIDRNLKRPLNDFRAKLGLKAVDRVLHKWVHSPQCVICFFPEWFAARQTDWPPHTHLVGFPLWDGGGAMSVPPEAQEFLAAGEPPVVFTPGSAAATMQRFFAESVATARRLDVRAMLITNFREQLPRDLPASVRAFGYLPFSGVLPRAALLVYHGGIGTLAQTIRAGIPHLVVPSGHDQFDNGWRIEQLGLGLCIPQARYRSERAANAIRSILADRRMIGQSRQYAAKTDSVAAVTRACELVEGLAVHRVQAA
ncbi:MAG TPA: nucleotide disphospho-sugar-binding domain-containing protein [Steroidobacteraceae bacterium]|nr:nucleotide disphospho-sugar-binding domain-containing protein [Steroidobacteraceae bacterium]